MKEKTLYDPKHTTSSEKHGGGVTVWLGHVWLPEEPPHFT